MRRIEITEEEKAEKEWTVKTPIHVAKAFELMEKNTSISKDELVTTALKMFIATHNDYLGLRP